MDQITSGMIEPHRIDLSREADFPLGDLSVRPSNRMVEGLGASQMLQPRVMQVLVALARPPSNVVSQDGLIRRCWGGLTVSDDAVGRCIGQLRKLAETWPEPPFIIVTVPGVGYRLDVKVGSAQGNTPRIQASAKAVGWRWPPLFSGFSVAATALAGFLWITHAGGLGASPLADRVAVLPVESLSTQPETRYLAASIADEVDRALSDSQVAVLPRADAATIGAAANITTAARMRVGLLVNGSIGEASGETLVNMRLENAATHVTLWSGDFRRPAKEASALREEIGFKVADLVAMAEFARETPSMRTDDAAMSAFLQAQQLIRSNRSASWGQLLALTQRVVMSEPNFAFGHSTAATAYAYAIGSAPAQQRPGLTAGARREAKLALSLDPHDAAAYFALYFLEPDYEHKEALLQKGLTTASRPAAPLAALYNSEGQILLATGRPDAALPYLQRSFGLDPLSPVKAETLIEAYYMAGEPGAAFEAAGQAIARWPNQLGLRATRLHLLTFYGAREAARNLLTTPADLPADLPPEAAAAWRQYLAVEPEHESADVARTINRAAEDGALDLRTAVLMLAQLHDLDDAFAQANKLADNTGEDPKFLFESAAAPLRHDPHFMRLAARFGLPAYWRATGRWPEVCLGPRAEMDCGTAISQSGFKATPA